MIYKSQNYIYQYFVFDKKIFKLHQYKIFKIEVILARII
jgi:hypothetical protein